MISSLVAIETVEVIKDIADGILKALLLMRFKWDC
jgi:hypothetical protein